MLTRMAMKFRRNGVGNRIAASGASNVNCWTLWRSPVTQRSNRFMQVMARPIERKEIVVGWASHTVLVTLVTINGVL